MSKLRSRPARPSFSGKLRRRGPLWLDVRNNTAGFLRSVPDSRFSRMRSTIKRAWSASKLRLRYRCPFGPEVLGKTLLGKADDTVSGSKDRLRRAIIAIERDDVGRRRELVGKIQDVAHGRGTERINRLGVVADNRQAAASGLERQQNRGLQPVRVCFRQAWVGLYSPTESPRHVASE